MVQRNLKLAAGFVVLPLVMLGLSFAAKPLYDSFCRVTGFGGTTQIAERPPERILERRVNIRFDANVNGAPIRFRPLEQNHEIRLGEHGLAFFEATNTSTEPVSVIASYNVTPHRAGVYFNKLECFCFEERVLQPGETKTLPVVFFVDPAMDDQRLMDDVHTITLSYTFFRTDTWPGASNGASLE